MRETQGGAGLDLLLVVPNHIIIIIIIIDIRLVT